MANREERSTETNMAPPAVRPFRTDVPEEDLVDLRRRIAATRWPERETITDVRSIMVRQLAHARGFFIHSLEAGFQDVLMRALQIQES